MYLSPEVPAILDNLSPAVIVAVSAIFGVLMGAR